MYEQNEISVALIAFGIIKPVVSLDGNMWCVLYGEDLQEGVAGFGESRIDAIKKWYREMNTKGGV